MRAFTKIWVCLNANGMPLKPGGYCGNPLYFVPMRNVFFLLFFVVFCVPGSTLAQTQIHQCKDADGGIVYSQLPCKDEEPAEPAVATDGDELESPEPVAIPAEQPLISSAAVEESVSDESTAACKKRYRDEIDAIDAEIRREYSPEKDSEYKQRLLALTRKLREC